MRNEAKALVRSLVGRLVRRDGPHRLHLSEDDVAALRNLAEMPAAPTSGGRDVGKARRLSISVSRAAFDAEAPPAAEPTEGDGNIESVSRAAFDAEAPPAAEPTEGDGNIEALGLSLSALSPELRRRFDLEKSVAGVVVTEIANDSIAARKGLRPGDVIVEVGQEEVSAPGDVARNVAKAKEEGRKSVLLLLNRKGDLHVVALRVG